MSEMTQAMLGPGLPNCSLVPWSQDGVFPLGLGGPPSPREEGNLGYEPTRDLPAGGDLGVGLQLEEAMFPTTSR